MRRIARSLNILAAVAVAQLCTAPFCLARTSEPDPYIPDDMRQLPGGRKVLLIMQTDALEPKMRFDQVRYTATGDSYVQLELAQSIEDYTREVLAVQAFINPLRGEIADFEFERRMRERLESVVNAAPWIGARDFELTHGYRAATVERVLNESDTRQTLLLVVGYTMSYQFDLLSVSLQASTRLRQIPKGMTSDARLKRDYIPYEINFEARLPLPGADRKNRQANRDRWAADHGKLARDALQAGLDFVTERFARTLAEDEAQSAAWRRRNGRAGRLPNGRPGWILESGPRGIVSYASRAHTIYYEVTGP